MSLPTGQPLARFLSATLALCSFAYSGGTAWAGNSTDYTYLALGDSVPFGLDVRLLVPPLPSPSQFIGYPEVLANWNHLTQSKKLENTACPGETSSSFVTPGVTDYGCSSLGPQGQPPFKTVIGLHTSYSGTQLSFAVDQLTANKHIDLVTLQVGANDVLLLLKICATTSNPDACVGAGLPGVFQTFGQNLATILTGIRVQAGYKGDLVLVLYYSPSPAFDQIAVTLNAIMLSVGTQFGTKFADGFTAFQLASAPFGGDPCQAGLLVPLSPTTCDIHPSLKGQEILAATVQAVVGKHL